MVLCTFCAHPVKKKIRCSANQGMKAMYRDVCVISAGPGEIWALHISWVVHVELVLGIWHSCHAGLPVRATFVGWIGPIFIEIGILMTGHRYNQINVLSTCPIRFKELWTFLSPSRRALTLSQHPPPPSPIKFCKLIITTIVLWHLITTFEVRIWMSSYIPSFMRM